MLYRIFRIAQKREEAVNREITKLFANDKNAQKNKDDRYDLFESNYSLIDSSVHIEF